MIDPAILRALQAAGATTDMIIAAIEADAAKDEEKRAARRAKATKRQQKKRQKDAMSRDVTRDERDEALQAVTQRDPLPNDIYSNPTPVPPVDAKASTAPKGRADKGSRIEEGWEPPTIAELSTEARNLAKQWPAASYRAEAEAFRNFWLAESGAKARKSNWNRAWANRIVAIHGKVMRDVKFGNVPADVGTARSGKEPETIAELERALAFAQTYGFSEQPRYIGYREKLEGLKRNRSTGPPRSIGQVAQQLPH